MTDHNTDTDQYTSGKFWDDLPDFLAGQAPRKISHLFAMVDFESLLRSLPSETFSMVDIGCGAGKVSTGVAERLRELCPKFDITVYGYDRSPQAIEAAKRENVDGQFVCGDYKDAGMTWDLALLIDIIEHIPDPDEFVRGVAERSRFYVIGFAMDDNLANNFSRARRERAIAGDHISLFNEKKALEVSGKYGKVLKTSYIANPLGRNLAIRHFRHSLTFLPRLVLQVLSRRLKGRVFGGESIYVFVESAIYKNG